MMWLSRLAKLTGSMSVGLGLACLVLVSSMSPTVAQNGWIITGSEDVDVLKHRLDFGGKAERLERYRLTVPPQDVAVAEIQINMGPQFDSTVDPNHVRLEVEGQKVELSEVYWNPEFRSLEVIAKEPIASGQEMMVVASRVRNPISGIYRFEGRVLGTEANPLFRLVGNWLIDIQDPVN